MLAGLVNPETYLARDPVLGGLCLAIPTDRSREIEDAIKSWQSRYKELNELQSHPASNCVVVCTQAMWDRLGSRPSVERKPFLDALRRTSDRGFSLVANVAGRRRDEFVMLLPEELPTSDKKAIPIRAMMRDIVSIQFSSGSTPTAPPTVWIENETSNAATKLHEVLAMQTSELDKYDLALQSPPKDNVVTMEFRRAVFERAATEWSKEQQKNQVRNVMMAMIRFERTHGILPPREVRSADRKPLLSWRVMILPFLDEQKLYQEFHLNEPWDSPHNRKLIERMPDVYITSPSQNKSDGKTSILLPMMKDSLWSGDAAPLQLKSVTDGLTNTVGLICGSPEQSVIWTKPDDLSLREDSLVSDLLGSNDSLWVGLLDGASLQIKNDVNPTKLKTLLTHQGGEDTSKK